MRHFIVATHACLSQGIQSALDMIIGDIREVSYYCAYVDDHIFFKDELLKEVDTYSPQDEILIFTDLFGGSVNNELLSLSERSNVYLISGINLILLISMLVASDEEPVEEMIERTIAEAKTGMMYCKNDHHEQTAVSLDEF